MARITVSLTDSLKSKLDAYADEQKLSVSRVVSQALQAFLPGEENPPDPDLVNTQLYLAQIVAQVEGFREAMHRMALAQYGPFAELPDDLTRSLPSPPWTSLAVEECDEEEEEQQ